MKDVRIVSFKNFTERWFRLSLFLRISVHFPWGGGGSAHPLYPPLDPPLAEIHGGNQLWFELARGSSLRGFELSGVNCNIFQTETKRDSVVDFTRSSFTKCSQRGWDISVFTDIKD